MIVCDFHSEDEVVLAEYRVTCTSDNPLSKQRNVKDACTAHREAALDSVYWPVSPGEGFNIHLQHLKKPGKL